MAKQSSEFWGWQAHDKSAAEGKMKWEKYEPKTWTENDVDIEIECCGICGSDLHTLRSGWAPADYPLTVSAYSPWLVCTSNCPILKVGHEIIGRAVRVGKEAEGGIKVGDRVGVGAQAAACLRPDCEECSNGLEHHCENPGNCNTFDSRYPDGSKATGGYAEYTRVPSHFVIKIPEAIPSIEAAPMMCAGVTVYAPLVENGAGPGTRVGVIGIGGLGHFALLWAKVRKPPIPNEGAEDYLRVDQALGCSEITAISRKSNKKEDALKMGATKFIATDEDQDWGKKNAKSLDLIICTVSSHNMPLSSYVGLLRVKGTLIMVGAPEDCIPGFNLFILIDKRAKIGGSAIGSPKQIRTMLDLAVKEQVHPWINLYPMQDANRAIVDFDEGKPRYRFVLQNDPGKTGTVH